MWYVFSNINTTIVSGKNFLIIFSFLSKFPLFNELYTWLVNYKKIFNTKLSYTLCFESGDAREQSVSSFLKIF